MPLLQAMHLRLFWFSSDFLLFWLFFPPSFLFFFLVYLLIFSCLSWSLQLITQKIHPFFLHLGPRFLAYQVMAGIKSMLTHPYQHTFLMMMIISCGIFHWVSTEHKHTPYVSHTLPSSPRKIFCSGSSNVDDWAVHRYEYECISFFSLQLLASIFHLLIYSNDLLFTSLSLSSHFSYRKNFKK